MRSRRAALAAASVSGASTSTAITTPTNDWGRPSPATAGFDRRLLDLGQPDHGNEGDHQQPQADQRRPVAGWGRVLLVAGSIAA